MINIIKGRFSFDSALGIPVSEKRKDAINKDIANKEIRILDLPVLLNTAASLKREKEDDNKGESSEDNEYRTF